MNNRPATPQTPHRRSIDGISRPSSARDTPLRPAPNDQLRRQPQVTQPSRPISQPPQRNITPPAAPPPHPPPPTGPVRILKPGHGLPPASTPSKPATTAQPAALRHTDGFSPNPAPTAITSSPPPSQPQVTKPVPQPTQNATPQLPPETTKPTKPKRKFLNALSYAGIALLAITVGFALFDAAVGQWIVIAGGIIALILRVDSRILFGAALFCLVMIPVMTLAGREALSENYALYTFILLAIGTVRAMIESATNGKKHNA